MAIHPRLPSPAAGTDPSGEGPAEPPVDTQALITALRRSAEHHLTRARQQRAAEPDNEHRT